MKNIVIKNPSSPGASLTANTDRTILACHQYIQKSTSKSMKFIDFRKALTKEYNINHNNFRNVLPLIRNMGFVQYEKNNELFLDKFFTQLGSAYVATLQGVQNTMDSPILPLEKRKSALATFYALKKNIAFAGLKNIISNLSINYAAECVAYLRYLQRYLSISKQEAALLVYYRELYPDCYLDKMSYDVSRLRIAPSEYNFQVDVRNDIQTENGTNPERRLTDLSCFTSYGYIINLLKDVDLFEENTTNLANGKQDKITELLGE